MNTRVFCLALGALLTFAVGIYAQSSSNLRDALQAGSAVQVLQAVSANSGISLWDIPGSSDMTALMIAAQSNRDIGAIYELNAILVARGIDINRVDNAMAGMTALMYAAQSNSNPAVIQVLLSLGADKHQPDLNGNTALWYLQQNRALKSDPGVVALLS